jgi:hypothetical protein
MEKLWKGKRKVVGDGNDGIDGGACAAYNRSSNSSSYPPWPSPCSEGRKWRKREPQRQQRKRNTPQQRTATQKERETEGQPALAFYVNRAHPSSALFIRPFLPEIHPFSSEFILHLHSSLLSFQNIGRFLAE